MILWGILWVGGLIVFLGVAVLLIRQRWLDNKAAAEEADEAGADERSQEQAESQADRLVATMEELQQTLGQRAGSVGQALSQDMARLGRDMQRIADTSELQRIARQVPTGRDVPRRNASPVQQPQEPKPEPAPTWHERLTGDDDL